MNEPWYNITRCPRMCGVTFENFHVTARQYRYEPICEIGPYDKEHDNFPGSIISGGGKI